MPGQAVRHDAAARFDATVRRFQTRQSGSLLASVPATILIATILGSYTAHELTWIAVATVIYSAVSVALTQTLDRRSMNRAKRALLEAGDDAVSLAQPVLRGIPRRFFIDYVVSYLIGAVCVTALGNTFAGLPTWLNLGPLLIAVMIGGTIDGTLNFFSGEILAVRLLAIVAEGASTFVPEPRHARGGIRLRVIFPLFVVTLLTMTTVVGGALHLFLQVQSKTVTFDQAMHLGLIYGLCALAVTILFTVLVTNVLVSGITRPIMRVVDLMERMRYGDLFRDDELFGEPVFAHEAGLLVHAFTQANRGLTRLADSGERLASGNLAIDITPHSDRDVVSIAFVKVVDAIRSVVAEVQTTALLLDESARQIAGRAEQFTGDASANARDLTSATSSMRSLGAAMDLVAAGADELSEMVDRARSVADRLGVAAQSNASGIDQLSRTTNATIEAAGDVLALSTSADASASDATTAIEQADRTSEEAQRVMHDLVETIGSLRESSQQIGSITQKIDEIADQTNLLALNAAIEAARAGEHGRGFAVVADEIRKLADSSAGATKEIASLIRSVQTETVRAVDVTQRGREAVESGRQKTSLVTGALEKIVENARSMRSRIDAVVLSQREQKSATDSLLESTLLLERMTGENAGLAQSLSDLSARLLASSSNGAVAVQSTSTDVASVAQRGERLAGATEELRKLTLSLRNEAERIRSAVSGFHDGEAIANERQAALTR